MVIWVPLLVVLVDAEDADVTDVVVTAGVDAAEMLRSSSPMSNW